MWGIPPPNPDPLLEVKYGRRGPFALAGTLVLALALVVGLIVVLAIIALLA
jgi:hypothetical protein